MPPKNNREQFAEKLWNARKAQKLTQQEAAALVGLSLAQYKRWEASKITPNSVKQCNALTNITSS
jgi:transcriptional regulator with XRE-family HTH domain